VRNAIRHPAREGLFAAGGVHPGGTKPRNIANWRKGERMILLGVALLAFLALVMALAWLVQALTRNAGWVDAFWSFGTGAAGVLGALWPLGDPVTPRQALVSALVAVWGVRLGLYIAERSAKGREDVRYARLREQWGAGYPARMFGFLMIQAVMGWLLSLSVLVAARNPAPSPAWADLVGVLLLGAAVAGEAVADLQMRAFRADPANRGQVMRRGLWSWSRHPNYFFQTLGWVAYPVIALGPPGSSWLGLIALTGPCLMYWLLVHVSGIPPLEREMLASRGDAFRAYQDETSAFFPLPPRRPRRQ
jgi:steroid 5-alpha reductase family enzyme